MLQLLILFDFHRFERYERALVKGHKQSLDRIDSKENVDLDTHKYKIQVMQLFNEGYKLRYVINNFFFLTFVYKLQAFYF